MNELEINIDINWSVNSEIFKHHIGRLPIDIDELDSFARLVKNGIDAQLDWDIIYSCAAEEFDSD